MDTFVVRIWKPAEPAAEGSVPALCGMAEHIPSHRSATFAGESELLAFLAGCVGPGANREADGDE